MRFLANKIRTDDEPFGGETQNTDTDKQEHNADPLVDFRVFVVVMVRLLILGFRRRFGCFNQAERVLFPWRVVQVDSRADITETINIWKKMGGKYQGDLHYYEEDS